MLAAPRETSLRHGGGDVDCRPDLESGAFGVGGYRGDGFLDPAKLTVRTHDPVLHSPRRGLGRPEDRDQRPVLGMDGRQ